MQVSLQIHNSLKAEAGRRNMKLYTLTDAVLAAWLNAGCPNLPGL